MAKFEAGNKVRIKGDAQPLGWLRPGETATITKVVGDVAVFLNYNYDARQMETSRYWFSEMERADVVEDDDPLREAISALPGLENSDLVWNHVTDPARFLERYGEVLSDLLTYYKKKEKKLEKISEALEVLYDV